MVLWFYLGSSSLLLRTGSCSIVLKNPVCPLNFHCNWQTKVSYFCMEKQGIMTFTFLIWNAKKIKWWLVIALLGVFLLESACSATGKSHKKYHQVPCPCINDRR